MARKLLKTCIAAVLSAAIGAATAGPVIIDGTDSGDHGSFNGAANVGGWLYMQKGLENLGGALAAGVTHTVVVLGIDGTTSSQARNSINSAFSQSSLAGAGWTISFVDGAAAIGTYFSTISTSNTGILYIPTAGNVGGDLTSAEVTAINANAAAINNFVSGAGNPTQGGALFSQAETGAGAYGWLTTLISGIVFNDFGGGGIGNPLSLTAAGNTAFPGLTNTDLSSGPWHGAFSGNLGGLSVLATGLNVQGAPVNVIIGGGAGTVIGCGQNGQPPCPSTVPEPGSLALLGLGLAAAFAIRRRKIT